MRHSLRSLVKDPMFTVVVMLTIALGIAANTAIFSVVHAVLLKPPPFVDPDRLAVIWETDPQHRHVARARILAGLSGHSAALAHDGRNRWLHRGRDELRAGQG